MFLMFDGWTKGFHFLSFFFLCLSLCLLFLFHSLTHSFTRSQIRILCFTISHVFLLFPCREVDNKLQRHEAVFFKVCNQCITVAT